MADSAPKPALIPAPHGPLILVDDPTPAPVTHLHGPKGETYERPKTVSLCRCGESKSKPFCDGTHSVIGFKSDNPPDGYADKLEDYPGPDGVTVHFNRHICSGASVCVRTLPSVFLPQAVDWIHPEHGSADELKRMIPACPSGALSYTVHGVRMPEPQREPGVKVVPNGPFNVVGEVPLVGAEFAQGASREHYTLCRCGRSRSKPFCDYSHAEPEPPWSDGSAPE